MTEIRINRIQADILRRLLEQDGLRFAQINTGKIPTDQFSYHLRQLIKLTLVEKLEDQTYKLTVSGKTRAIMLKPDHNSFIEQGFTAVLVVATRVVNGETQYLLQERAKVPYKGLISLSGDKIYYGEEVSRAASRALKAQTGLAGEVSLRSVWHIMDEHNDVIVQDKFFYVFEARKFNGEVISEGLTGRNMWMTRSQLDATDMKLENGPHILDSLTTPLSYHETIFKTKDY